MDDLFLISPDGIRELFPVPERDHLGPPPSPDEKPAGGATGVAEIPDEAPLVPEHPFLEFRPSAVPEAGENYVLQDRWGRILGVQNGGADTSDWALMLLLKDAPGDLFPVTFGPVTPNGSGTFYVKVQNGNAEWVLRSNGTSSSSNQTFWAPTNAEYPPSQYPFIAARPVLYSTKNGQAWYGIEWPMTSSATLYFQADDGPGAKGLWVWSEYGSRTPFIFHEIYIKTTQIQGILQREWPKADILHAPFIQTDDIVAGISDQQIRSLFTDSKLGRYVRTPGVFGSADFSFVFKAQAAQAAYAAGQFCGYAVGIIYGRDSNGVSRTANLYLDQVANVKILDPITGDIMNGKDWEYTPYFIVL
jgi:hypothetical protein